MFETIIQRSHDEITEQRRAGNYSFDWSAIEEAKAPTIILSATNEEAVVWKCRGRKAEFGYKPSLCIHCGCQIMDGIPF
jgi:hypothetical protein